MATITEGKEQAINSLHASNLFMQVAIDSVGVVAHKSIEYSERSIDYRTMQQSGEVRANSYLLQSLYMCTWLYREEALLVPCSMSQNDSNSGIEKCVHSIITLTEVNITNSYVERD